MSLKTNVLKQEPITLSCPEQYTLMLKALLLLAALVKETPTAAQAAKKNSMTANMKISASECCV